MGHLDVTYLMPVHELPAHPQRVLETVEQLPELLVQLKRLPVAQVPEGAFDPMTQVGNFALVLVVKRE